jgi:hypothetical protein
MNSLPILKSAVILRRQGGCGECAHVVYGPAPWSDRKFYCAKLFNGDAFDRNQPAYLARLTERPDAACPAGVWAAANAADLRTPADPPHEIVPLGPWLWKLLHDRPQSFAGDAEAELRWLAEFERRVPCGACRQHWRDLVRRHPPDLSSADAYYRWTVDRHNDVNRRLDKPAWFPETAGSGE